MNRRETTHAERVEIVERHLRGETLYAIAQDMGLSYYTVRHWWRVFCREGWEGLIPKAKGRPLTGIMSSFDPQVKFIALRLKLKYPGWGVDRILLEMSLHPKLQGKKLPKRSTLASYFKQFGDRLLPSRKPKTKKPKKVAPRAEEPHQCWQMDFKGEEKLEGCNCVITAFMISDEASGAPLEGRVHQIKAKGQRAGLTTRDVQEDLRKAFQHWGLPDAVRMDRDPLFVGSSRLEWPGVLLLWLVGLGVTPVINRPYRPTENAIVERNHLTWKKHVLEGQRYQEVEEVQRETDRDFLVRREKLPSRHRGCNGRSPVEAFPALRKPRKAFTVEREEELFDLGRVDAYLSQWEWKRVVDSRGKISLADRNYYVGERFRGQVVKVRFEPSTREFGCYKVDGEEIARFEVPEVSKEYIFGRHNSPPMGMT